MTTPGRCAACGQGRPIELEMTVKSGAVLTMLSCPRCETRSWLADGEPVSKDDVLRMTSGDADFVMTASAKKPRRTAGRR